MEVARVYMRVKFEAKNDEAFNAVAHELEDRAVTVAKSIFDKGFRVEIAVAEGSLRITIVLVAALIGGFYETISKYHDFKEGLSEIQQDAEKFVEVVKSQIMAVTRAEEPDILSSRVRFQDLERLQRLSSNVESLNRQIPSIDRQHVVEEVHSDLAGLYRSGLTSEEYRKLLDTLPIPKIPEIPREPEAVAILARERTLVSDVDRNAPGPPVRGRRQLDRPKRKYRNSIEL